MQLNFLSQISLQFQTEIRKNYGLARELAKATLVYAEGDDNREKRWEASDRAEKIIEEKYSFVSFNSIH